MDSNVKSLSLALENHELGDGTYSASGQHAVQTTPKNEKSNFRFDIADKSNDSIGHQFNGVFLDDRLGDYDNDFDSYEKLTYETAQRLFEQISNRDPNMRRQGLDILSNSIFQWVRDSEVSSAEENSSKLTKSIKSDVMHRQDSSDSNHEIDENCHKASRRIVRQALASLLRLSIQCPFIEVRRECRDLLQLLKNRNVDVPTVVKRSVSRFIPNNEISPVDTDDEQTYSLYEESFIHNCRLEHMVMVMALHPQYLQQFLDTNYHLMQSKGVLSYHFRSYIAIMAAARHQCTYLVHLMESHFLLQGGDREWLLGVDHVPPKLRALSTLNKLLAHRPWLVTPKHIKELVDGESGSRWQHPELAQAIVLLCHFHGLAIFCHGSGTNLEIDHETAHSFHNTSTRSPSSAGISPHSSPTSGSSTPGYGRISPVTEGLWKDAYLGFQELTKLEQTGDVEVLMERMKRLQEDDEEMTREELNRRFEKEKEEASHEMIPGVNGSLGGAAYFARYVVDPDFSYQEFAKRDAAAEIPTFREQDYSWSDHACLVVRKYFSDVADKLDNKFNTAYYLTYKTLASKDNVDTSSLRRAIWMYVHCMYGIMYDDYNYGEVNQLLERPLKIFIKTVSCFPEQTTRKIYDGFWKQFRHSEKVHVNIMLMEARMQVGLLYGMRALTEYLRDS